MSVTDGSVRGRDELGFAKRSMDLSTPFVPDFSETRSISGNGVNFASTVSVQQDTSVTFTDGNLTTIDATLLTRVQNLISGDLGALESATGGGSAQTYLRMNIQLDSPADLLVNGMMSVASTPPGPDPVSNDRIEASFTFHRANGPFFEIDLDHKFYGTATAPIDISASLPPGQYYLDVLLTAGAASSPPLDDALSKLNFIMHLTPVLRGWIDPAGGDWSDGGNWSAGEPPGTNDTAEFHLSDTYTVNFTDAAVSQAAVIRGGNVTFQMPNHQLTVERLEVGGDTSSGATLNVAADIFHRSGIVAEEVVVGKSGTLTHTGQAYVGYTTFSDTDPNRLLTDLHAKRSLRIENGGHMKSQQAKVLGPAESNGTGVATVNIAGAGSMWEVNELELGGAEAGRINITGGGELNVFPNGRIDAPTTASESIITVNGFGTLGEQIVPSRLIASNLRVGIDGYARIHVNGRGQVGADSAILGEAQGSRGVVIVEGEGTKWLGANTEANTISVGRDGRGELIVRDGADFRASISEGELSSLDEGIVTIDGKGSATPQSEQTFVRSFNTGVGRAGLGEMIIRQGAQFEAGAVRLGDLVGGNGLIQVVDPGTKMTVDAFLTLGGFGSGGLFINNEAIVEGPLAVFTVESGGIIEIRNGARLDIAALNIEPNGFVVGDEGSLRLTSEEFLSNDGHLAIGSSPGQFTIEGSYRQGESGVLEIEVAGLTPSDEFDVLTVTGDVEIDGRIELKFIDGFAPQQGQTFEFLTVGGTADLSGASFEIQNLAPGFMFDITPSAGGIKMTALNDGEFLLAGDYSADGMVDAADYVAWRNTDAMQEGYNIWRANFGRTSGSGAALSSANPLSATVPEPASARLLLMVALALAVGRRRLAICAKYSPRSRPQC